MVMVYLSLSVLIAYVASVQRTRMRACVTAAVAVLVVADFAWALPTYRVTRPAIYRELAAQPDGAVLELPLGIRDGFGERGHLDHRVLFYQSLHGHPIAGGFVARMTESLERAHLSSPLLGPLLELSEGRVLASDESARLREEGRALLRASHFRYVVLSRDAPGTLRTVVEAWGTRTAG